MSSERSPPGGTHLLVVEDEVEVVQLLRRYFEGNGFRVTAASDGPGMREAMRVGGVDLVLLDLGLPGEDGLELIRQLRTTWLGPIVVVTGRGDAVDRIVGLELGADDYVSKPFDLRELLARVRSVLRRAAPAAALRPDAGDASAGMLEFDGLRLDPAARELRDRDGCVLALTTGEFELLMALATHPQRVLSRDALMNAMHGRDAGPYDRAIDVQVGRLRRKIERDPARPALVKSVRGAGYQFAARVRRT